MAHISRNPIDLARLGDMHPELNAYIKEHKNDPHPDGLAGIRAYYEQINQRYLDSFGPDSASDVLIQNRTVRARDGYDIPIRTYRPAASGESGPLIVSIHGGGMCLGSLTDEEGHCRLFVKTFGASCVNIDYRLAPEMKQPTQVYDCWDVITWAVEHVAELGADPGKGFLVQGVSAGAVLADLVSRIAKDEKLQPPITGQLHIATAVCDQRMVPKRYRDQFLSWDQDMSGSLPKDVIAGLRQMRAANPEDQWSSPMVSWPSGNQGLPRTVLMVHGRDYFRDIGLIYERILREEAGVETKLYVYPGLPHGFNGMLAGGEASKEHLRDMVEGIRWLLQHED
jgi:acetyl esterase/lipase